MRKKSVIVIGAGIGGIATAILLAHKGYAVTIIEKNKQPGGKILQLKKNGFTFDGGASFITLLQVYREFFQSIGRDIQQYIQFTPLPISTTFHFTNGKKLLFQKDLDKMRAAIKKDFPGDEDGFDKFIHRGKDIYSIMYQGPRYAQRNYHKFFGFDYALHPRILKDLGIIRPWETWEQWVNQLFRHEELRAAFSYQATFAGASPSQTLSAFSFLTYAEIVEGMYNVSGGVYGIVEGFMKVAKEEGVTCHFGEEVTKLLYQDKEIIGVQTNKRTLKANIIVNNSDGAYFYTHLFPKKKYTEWSEKRFAHMQQSNGYFVINLGLKKPLPDITHHTFFVPQKWKEFFTLIASPNTIHRMTFDSTAYYLVQKSMQNPWMAPKGKATLFILVPVSGYNPGFDWKSHEHTFKNFVYDMLEQRDHIQIRSLIEEEIVYSPARWGKEFNLWENIILGPSLTFFQANGFRLPNKAKEFTNLYHVGTSTIPGPSLPACIDSARLVTERIITSE